MSVNVEFFIKLENAEIVKENVLQFDKCGGDNYYDKDGNKIDVYFKRSWIVSDYEITLNNKTLGLEKIRELFYSRNKTLVTTLDFSISGAEHKYLCVTFTAKDRTQTDVIFDILSEFLYEVFDKEVEF